MTGGRRSRVGPLRPLPEHARELLGGARRAPPTPSTRKRVLERAHRLRRRGAVPGLSLPDHAHAARHEQRSGRESYSLSRSDHGILFSTLSASKEVAMCETSVPPGPIKTQMRSERVSLFMNPTTAARRPVILACSNS
mgnify:CR=1 FL=1